MHRLRDLLLAAVSLVLATGPLGVDAAPLAPGQEYSAAVPVVRIDGRGHGHGIGLSQWGAYSLAADGADYATILTTFYPDTTLGHAGGEIAVTIDERPEVRLSFPDGGELHSSRSGENPAPEFPISVPPDGIVTVRRSAHGYEVVGTASPAGGAVVRYRADQDCILLCPQGQQQDCLLLCPPPGPTTSTTTTTARPDEGGSGGGDGGGEGDGGGSGADGGTSTTTAPAHPTSPTPIWAVPGEGGTVQSVDRGRTYRGVFEVGGTESGLTVRNHLDVENYLMGMAETPGSWPAAALQAQAVAARTFALRSGGDICDSQRCQVYIGTAGENPGQTAAVNATRGVVVTYQGALAATHYSASAGGISATPAEGFGLDGEIPYLRAIRHPDVNPQPWELDVALEVIGRRFHYPGEVTGVAIDEVGPSGRPLAISIRGDAGPAAVDPLEFRHQLGLRSTLYTLAATEADEAPPPPKAVTGPDVVGTQDFSEAPIRPPVAESRVDLALAEPTEGWSAARRLAIAAAVVALAAAAALVAITAGRHGWRPSHRRQ